MQNDKIKLIKTCHSCPEQYDLFYDDVNIGYLRLRHGSFTAEYVPTDEIVYEAEPDGDGMFEKYEREGFLNNAIEAILSKHLKNNS